MGMQENNMPKTPILEASDEELELEFQEIMKKRTEYQKEVEQAAIAFQKDEEKKKRKRRAALGKAAVIVLVIGTCLIGFASRSEATRMWWLSSVERIIGKDTGHVVDNDENRVISNTSAHEAAAVIEEKTGIPMPELQYEPPGMIFDGYDYDDVILRSGMYFLYDDYIISLYAYSSDEDSSYSWNYDGDVIFEKEVQTGYGDVMLLEIQAENDEISSVAAEWEYQNHQYQLFGKISMEEMEKIILNIFY